MGCNYYYCNRPDINEIQEEIKTEINNKESNKINNITEIKKIEETYIIDYNKENNIEFQKIKTITYLKDITNDSYTIFGTDNTFLIFKSINSIIYLIYSTINKSIILYNILNNNKITEIKSAHKEYITNFRHFLHKKNKTDLIISISGYDNNIKLWNINDIQCILNLENVYNEGYIYSACFLYEINIKEIYIISSSYNIYDSEPIKVFNLKGQKIKEIKNSNDETFFIETYYDNENNKIYIITGINSCIKSYDYYKNEIYKKYCDNENTMANCSIIIYDKEKIVKLISSSYDGNIRIWNFHKGNILNKYKVFDYQINGICLWNKDYLVVGCLDQSMKIIDLIKGEIIKELKNHNDQVITIKKIFIEKYGKCLVSQGLYNDQIKLWVLKN